MLEKRYRENEAEKKDCWDVQGQSLKASIYLPKTKKPWN
jgi:hypothetical protein